MVGRRTLDDTTTGRWGRRLGWLIDDDDDDGDDDDGDDGDDDADNDDAGVDDDIVVRL